MTDAVECCLACLVLSFDAFMGVLLKSIIHRLCESGERVPSRMSAFDSSKILTVFAVNWAVQPWSQKVPIDKSDPHRVLKTCAWLAALGPIRN